MPMGKEILTANKFFDVDIQEKRSLPRQRAFCICGCALRLADGVDVTGEVEHLVREAPLGSRKAETG